MSTTDREARKQKLRRVQTVLGIAALAGLGVFAELAAHTGHTAAEPTAPDQQVTSLENANNGAFFSTGGNGFAPPGPGSGSPQTSSGGS
jgi:hypothetical protein